MVDLAFPLMHLAIVGVPTAALAYDAFTTDSTAGDAGEGEPAAEDA
jgi:hypothetical protein